MFSNIDYFNIDVFFEHRPSLGRNLWRCCASAMLKFNGSSNNR